MTAALIGLAIGLVAWFIGACFLGCKVGRRFKKNGDKR